MDNNQFGNGIPTDNNYQGRPMQQNMNNVPMQNTQNTNPQFVIGGQNNGYRNPNPPTQPTQNGGGYGQYNNPQYMQQQPVAPLQPPTQIPIPPVPPVPSTPQTPPMPPEQPKKAKKDKKVKEKKNKKKHGFLKFLLFSFLFIAVCVASVFIINKVTENQMNAFMPEHPYVLDSADTRYSIQNNFYLPKNIDYNGKQKEISWKSNSDVVKLEEAEGGLNAIIVPSEKPARVTLTATYKFLLIGKAEKTFVVKILPTSTINVDDVHVVDIEAVKDKTYDENMTMVLRDDKTVASMYGDFKQKIYHSGDALVVLNAYKTELGFAKDVEFIEREIVNAETTTYLFDMAYNGVAIEDSTVYLSVNEKFELNSIKCNFDKSIEQYKNVSGKPREETIDILGEQLGRTGDDTIAVVAGERYENIDGKNCLVITYLLFYSNGETHVYDVNETTGTVIGEVTHNTYLFEGLVEGFESCIGDLQDAMTTDATGKGIKGDTKSFTASHIGPLHLLYNPQKNITAFHTPLDLPALFKNVIDEQLENWGIRLGHRTKIKIIDEFIDLFSMLDYLIYSGKETLQSVIAFELDDHFDAPLTEIAVDSYYGISVAYDYFNNRFDRWSYNNKGAAVRVFTHSELDGTSMTDNACWNKLYKCFYTYPAKDFKYSVAAGTEVLGHEYTHAVFGAYANGGGEISGINEAYADSFGILMSHPNNWSVGENVYNGTKFCIRDLEEINSSESAYTVIYKYPAPEKYNDKYWKAWGGEEHAISCMLGNIIYKMYSSGHFSQYELESILYKSLTYGYSGDDTFVTFRQQVLQAMKELKFTAEERDFVRTLFDEKEIFDYTDVYECEPEPTPEEIAYEELLEKLKGLNSDGDSLHRFAIMTSPIGFGLNKVPLYVFEERNNPSSEEEKLINDFLNQYWVMIGGQESSEEIGEFVGQREGNAIEYRQIPSWGMDIIETFLGKTHAEIYDIASGAISDGSNSEEEQSIIDTIVNLIFIGQVGESSRQDFFEGMIE